MPTQYAIPWPYSNVSSLPHQCAKYVRRTQPDVVRRDASAGMRALGLLKTKQVLFCFKKTQQQCPSKHRTATGPMTRSAYPQAMDLELRASRIENARLQRVCEDSVKALQSYSAAVRSPPPDPVS